jgi:hypothetical protein
MPTNKSLNVFWAICPHSGTKLFYLKNGTFFQQIPESFGSVETFISDTWPGYENQESIYLGHNFFKQRPEEELASRAFLRQLQYFQLDPRAFSHKRKPEWEFHDLATMYVRAINAEGGLNIALIGEILTIERYPPHIHN